MSTGRVKPVDPLLLAAYEAQAAHTLAWLEGLADVSAASVSGWSAASRLSGWSVAELVGHLVSSGSPYAEAGAAPRSTKALTVAAYVAGDVAVPVAPAVSPEAAVADFAAAVRRVVETPVDDVVVLAPRGPVLRSDLLRTRVVELVVHALDVDGGPALDRQAVRVCVRLLAQVLLERHGGKAVEVRVPPYAAVQLGAGVTHTRGTPPNVVEMSPEVFVAVASGRRAWASAVEAGDVRASGLRADLTPYLPLL